MTPIHCPVCSKRVCDSNRPSLKIAKLSNSNVDKADIVIKCKNCKTCLAVRVPRNIVRLRSNEPPQSG